MTPALLALAVAAAASQTPASGSILTLDEALARARAHPRVAQSEAAVSQAQARSREVFAGFLPAASATASYERATSNVVAQEVTAVDARGNPVTLRPSDATTPSYGAALNVQVPIWDFGRTL
ncbi:MAG TPA: TolC family protein, partial [Anaeromyxobacteraceae bacterium]